MSSALPVVRLPSTGRATGRSSNGESRKGRVRRASRQPPQGPVRRGHVELVRQGRKRADHLVGPGAFARELRVELLEVGLVCPTSPSTGTRATRTKIGKLHIRLGLKQGPDWLHEVKYDDFRVLANKQAERIRLWSRRRLTDRLPDARLSTSGRTALLAGKSVVLRADHRPVKRPGL